MFLKAPVDLFTK